jgi:hypothetical protein
VLNRNEYPYNIGHFQKFLWGEFVLSNDKHAEVCSSIIDEFVLLVLITITFFTKLQIPKKSKILIINCWKFSTGRTCPKIALLFFYKNITVFDMY